MRKKQCELIKMTFLIVIKIPKNELSIFFMILFMNPCNQLL